MKFLLGLIFVFLCYMPIWFILNNNLHISGIENIGLGFSMGTFFMAIWCILIK